MKRLIPFLLGPEVMWLIYYGWVLLIARLTSSPVRSMDSFWISTTYIIPLLMLPMTFGLYFVSMSFKPLLLLRLWIAGIIGGHLVLSRSLQAHSEQGPGVGTAYIFGMGLMLVVLVLGSIWASLRF